VIDSKGKINIRCLVRGVLGGRGLKLWYPKTMLRAAFCLILIGVILRGEKSGDMLANLTRDEREAFVAGKEAFVRLNSVLGDRFYPDTEAGLGPLFNLDSCGGCHAFPAPGGSSPRENPQFDASRRGGARNEIPWFLRLVGPAYQARQAGRGEVIPLFTITGRKDAADCEVHQPIFNPKLDRDAVRLRIPTPLYGAGFIDAIDAHTILRAQSSDRKRKDEFGISGHPNRLKGGAIGKFGWKAQTVSLFEFVAEAYWTEQGVTSEMFPQERNAECSPGKALPEDVFKTGAKRPLDGWNNVTRLSYFVRFLAPPAAATPVASDSNLGKRVFDKVGCALCHVPSLQSGSSVYPVLSKQEVPLYSDLLVHDMGRALADHIEQGSAGGREFRTAPLWGVGQRLYFLHDGRATSLDEAISAHGQSSDSEGFASFQRYQKLPADEKTALIGLLKQL
jgi:CxxC motif-containing protein (DUF1111 family)